MKLKTIRKGREIPPKYTLLITYCRPWMFDKLAEWVNRIDLPLETTKEIELIFLWDGKTKGENIKHYFAIWEWLELMGDVLGFNGIKFVITEQDPLDEKDRVSARRKRIISLLEEVKPFIGNSKIFMQLEDDSLPGYDAFKKLLKTFKTEHAGFVQAIEAGRHIKHAGAWKIDNVEDPQTIETLPYKESGIEEIQGGGFYCYVTRTELFKNAEFRATAECLGVDVNFVLDIVRQGYKAFVDWGVVCGHYQKNGKIILPDAKMPVLKWRKAGDNYRQCFGK